MFRRHKNYKRSNPIFVIFRLILSLVIFAVLLGGIYSAYKQFSGLDPVKISPKAFIENLASPDKLINLGLSLLSLDLSKIVAKPKQESTPINQVDQKNQIVQTNTNKPKSKSVSLKFALIADSHNENNFLAKALNQAKERDVQFITGLGDYTEVGTINELENAKKEFDTIGIRYFVTAGDHDLWDSRDKGKAPMTNINQIFGSTYQGFKFGNAKIIILDNSDNYLGFGENQIKWLSMELDKTRNDPEINVIFALMHESLYHPSSTRFMGKVTPSLKNEALKVTKILKDAGVKEAFFGDIHFFSRYSEPKSGLNMTTIGAIASLRNTQEPRFGVVTVYEDGSYEVEDVEIK